MDPKKKLSQLEELVADLLIGQEQLTKDVTALKELVGALVVLQRENIEFQSRTAEFQAQTAEFQFQTAEFQFQTAEFQAQTVESLAQTAAFQRQSLEYQQISRVQMSGIFDILRQALGEFQEIKVENKRFGEYETRLRTLESIVLKAS